MIGKWNFLLPLNYRFDMEGRFLSKYRYQGVKEHLIFQNLSISGLYNSVFPHEA